MMCGDMSAIIAPKGAGVGTWHPDCRTFRGNPVPLRHPSPRPARRHGQPNVPRTWVTISGRTGVEGLQDLLPCSAIAPTRRASTEGQAMAHNFAINDDVHHQLQGPQGRAVTKQRSVYTIVSCLPIEADGRPRYRIKSKTENVERVVTEEQISRLY